MAQDSIIRIRIDEETKKEADILFQDLGMDTSTAIRVFLRQSIKRGGIPFEVSDPFYSEANMSVLRKRATDMDAGKAQYHELSEDNDAQAMA